jgi:hypothetical protein
VKRPSAFSRVRRTEHGLMSRLLSALRSSRPGRAPGGQRLRARSARRRSSPTRKSSQTAAPRRARPTAAVHVAAAAPLDRPDRRVQPADHVQSLDQLGHRDHSRQWRQRRHAGPSTRIRLDAT